MPKNMKRKKNPCWKGYRKVKGKADYAPKSCVKNKQSKRKGKKKSSK